MSRDQIINLLYAVIQLDGHDIVKLGDQQYTVHEIATAAIEELEKPQIVNIDHVDVFNG